MEQTCAGSHIECILVDDCSPDASMERAHAVVDSYQGDIEFVFTKNPVNSGVSAARNRGLSLAQGKYVFFVDSDDDLAPHVLELFMNKMKQYPGASAVLSNSERDGVPRLSSELLPEYLEDKSKILELFFRGYLPDTVWNILIDRQVITRNQLTFKQGIIHEDVLWAFHMFEAIDSLAIIPDITYHYEENPHSIVNTKKKDYTPYVKSLLFIINDIYERFHHELYVDNMLYLMTSMILLIENVYKYKCPQELVDEVKALRSKIQKKSLKDGRILLSLFGLLMYSPYRNVFKLHLFRASYNKLRNVVRDTSLMIRRP